MNAKTLTALRGSIAKWEAIVAGTGKDLGAANCPLCKMFFYWDGEEMVGNCEGCPVMEKTGQIRCAGSPYDEIENNIDPDEYHNEYHIAAQREVDFLRSLLPSVGEEK
jgi:hypothetical protein